MSDDPTTRDPLPPDAPDLSGTQFTIEKLLGQGGFGAAYQVFNRGLRRRCVLKLLTNRAPGVVARFFREAQVIANIDHPGIVRAFEVATLPSTGMPYIVMEFVNGVPLGEHLATAGVLPIPEACEIAAATAEALSAAHEQGVIHRDIKLPNILITPKGQVKVIDFGIAHQRVEDFGDGPKIKTMMGQLLGTPRYMSPEQVLGLPLSPASDFYSLGVVLSLLLTGKSPFDGTAQAMMTGHAIEPPPTLTALGGVPFPPALEALFARLLAKEPIDRPGHGEPLAHELRAIARAAKPAAVERPFHDEPTMARDPAQSAHVPTPALPLDPSTIAAVRARPTARTEVRVDAARLVAISAEASVAYSALDATALPPHATQVLARVAEQAARPVTLAALPPTAMPAPYAPALPATREHAIVPQASPPGAELGAPARPPREPTPSDVQTFVQAPPPRAKSRSLLLAVIAGVVAAVAIAVVVLRGTSIGSTPTSSSGASSEAPVAKKPVADPAPTASSSASAPSSTSDAQASTQPSTKPSVQPTAAGGAASVVPTPKPGGPAAPKPVVPTKPTGGGAADDPF